ncbi:MULTISPECIES: hypothetical protein [unclassified Mesorhizobium]|uniref:hypothetical protein n=1 Tax=unclassified Mesorhizobium TaxID=325217 RepID=UPI000FDAC428|nr:MULTISPECIES: hypothetical protein [unclassified Mesorhizobium]TGQ28591.1 hypothetical protein EN859_034450 [Mesorhizobium sp. M00.F.Ca.ET.216.01.1.1]TIS53745.1 MAG: hypothetical protein E5W91_29605 [Mesorhizobium sp.]TIS86104.1 MAG: hypothetical protein E5W89_30315 [Mesorhizobium sp.]TJW03888.1 MAG: hypothetical protein E5W82_31815 [Mesorhizobium sp.]TJW41032.1 MAG: hypothetical protein E5W83_27005 [Mesorhizobium sp.]
MRYMKTPDAPVVTVEPIVKSPKVLSARLTIRSDEAARRKIADTDGTVRRARQIAESNRLI